MGYPSKAEIGSPQGASCVPFEMLRNPQKEQWRGWYLLAVSLFCFSACGKPKSDGLFPVTAPTLSKSKALPSEGVTHRARGGSPLGPAVLTDTPGTVARSAERPRSTVTPPVNTLNGDPQGLKRVDLDRGMFGAMQSMSACFTPGTPNPTMNLSFEAEPSGRTSLVRLQGAPADAEPCIRKIVQEMRLPSFEGKAVPVEMPLVFHEVKHKEEVRNAKPREPATPALFVQP